MSCGCGESRPVGIREAIAAARKALATLNPENRVTDDLAASHGLICRECPSRVRKYGVDWCGEPLRKMDTTCGCIVYLKIRTPGEACPQRHWANADSYRVSPTATASRPE